MAGRGAVQGDLLTRIRAELEQRMEELRPLCEEYERLTEVAATLEAVEQEAAHAERPAVPTPPPKAAAATPPPEAAAARRRGRPPRALAAKAIPSAPAAGASPSAAVSTDDEPAFDEPEPKPARISSSEVGQAIIAALEHGSHTVSELVMVTAISPTEIRSGLGRLRRQRKIAKVKRPSDGKSAYALPLLPAHT